LDFDKISSLPIWAKILASLIPIITCLLALMLIWGVGKKPQRSAHWWKLKSTIEDVIDSYQPIIRSRSGETTTLAPTERIAWLKHVRQLLDSQVENPVLLADDDALGHWRSAQDAVRMAINIQEAFAGGNVTNLSPDQPVDAGDLFRRFSERIVTDVMDVFVSKVFYSNEPRAARSPKPTPKKS
jgi:hypothetical protein